MVLCAYGVVLWQGVVLKRDDRCLVWLGLDWLCAHFGYEESRFRRICCRGVGYPLRGVSCRRKSRKRKSARYVEIELILIVRIAKTYWVVEVAFLCQRVSSLRLKCVGFDVGVDPPKTNLVRLRPVWAILCVFEFRPRAVQLSATDSRPLDSWWKIQYLIAHRWNLRQQVFGSLANQVGRISLPTSPSILESKQNCRGESHSIQHMPPRVLLKWLKSKCTQRYEKRAEP